MALRQFFMTATRMHGSASARTARVTLASGKLRKTAGSFPEVWHS